VYLQAEKWCEASGLGVCHVPVPPRRSGLEEYRLRTEEERVLRERAFSNRQRVKLNRDQPLKVPKFTQVGFELLKIPDSAWIFLRSFYDRRRHEQDTEFWPPGDAHVNHWESPTYIIKLPDTLRPRIFEQLQPILEQWSQLSLKPTSCYGIRVYKNNSILEDHVDRVQTHVISAILQIDQDVDEPWPLNIHSHDGRRHSIVLQPRDMLIYESASCIHGRSAPMRGRYYANVFVHFKPNQDWNFPEA